MPTPSPTANPVASQLPPTGRIDIHSHLLPGVDDGCQTLEESLACIRLLKHNGFVGTICTPHMAWVDDLPECTPAHVAEWVSQLRQQLKEHGENYAIWPGGELRLFDGVIDWLKQHGVPTLAGSRCVLTDMWETRWPTYAVPAFRWLIDQGYQPILAHPERLNCPEELPARLAEVQTLGVWLQGNANCFTGAEGYHADIFVRQFLAEGRYRLLGLDMHRPDTLPSRFDGLDIAQRESGQKLVDALTITAPRRDIFGLRG